MGIKNPNPNKVCIESKFHSTWSNNNLHDKKLDNGELIMFAADTVDLMAAPVLKIGHSKINYDDSATLISTPGIPLSFQQISKTTPNNPGQKYSAKFDRDGNYVHPIGACIPLSQYGVYERMDANLFNTEFIQYFTYGIVLQLHGYNMCVGECKSGIAIDSTDDNNSFSKNLTLTIYPITNGNTTYDDAIKLTIMFSYIPANGYASGDEYFYGNMNTQTYNVYPSVDYGNLYTLKELGFVDYVDKDYGYVPDYEVIKPMPIMWYMG